jgi:hypothetical protein
MKTMAVHTDLRSMSIEAIDEYLAIAKHCVTTEKARVRFMATRLYYSYSA